ncbi:uncharacterized protein [Bombus fervidus]|uniref:uncharacterized protein n=1 Tax=Bombus fervidus TaxID=203811 RepID=UPI003AB57974
MSLGSRRQQVAERSRGHGMNVLSNRAWLATHRLYSWSKMIARCRYIIRKEDFKFTELRNIQTIGRLSDAEFATSSRGKNGNTSDLQQPRVERHRSYRRHGVAIIKIRHGVFDSVVVRTINGISFTGSIRAQR